MVPKERKEAKERRDILVCKAAWVQSVRLAKRETQALLAEMALMEQPAFLDLKEQKEAQDHQALMVSRVQSVHEVPQDPEVQKEKRVILELEELQESQVPPVKRVLQDLREELVPKELLEEREILGPREPMAREVQRGKMVLKACKVSKAKLVSKGTREIEALWDLLAPQEQKDQRAKQERKDREEQEDQKDRGVLKVKLGLPVLLVSKVYRVELEEADLKDPPESKVSRGELVHPVLLVPREFLARLAACLGEIRAENDDPFLTMWKISLSNSPLVFWRSWTCLKTWKHPLVDQPKLLPGHVKKSCFLTARSLMVITG